MLNPHARVHAKVELHIAGGADAQRRVRPAGWEGHEN